MEAVEAIGFALALSPFFAVLALLLITVRRQWRQAPRLRCSVEPLHPRRDEGPDGEAVREPRRPLVPSGARSAALALPESDRQVDPTPNDSTTRVVPPRGHRLAG